MATTYLCLGQVSPAATTPASLYTVGSLRSAVISSLIICNTNATPVTYRISVRPAGAVQTTAMYIAYDVTLPANTSDTLTLGLTLATTDVVTVYASATNVAFSAFGSEIA